MSFLEEDAKNAIPKSGEESLNDLITNANVNLIFAVAGIIGSVFLIIADILRDFKGKDNKEVNNIQTNWKKMHIARFQFSIVLSVIGCPLANLGLYSLGNQLSDASPLLGFLFKLLFYFGAIGGMFNNTVLNIIPTIYKALSEKKDADLALNAVYDAVEGPLMFFMFFTNIGNTGAILVSFLRDFIPLPKFLIITTPYIITIISMVLKQIKYDWFFDFPGIIASSLSLLFTNIIALLNIVLH